jgi:hypothetical protein
LNSVSEQGGGQGTTIHDESPTVHLKTRTHLKTSIQKKNSPRLQLRGFGCVEDVSMDDAKTDGKWNDRQGSREEQEMAKKRRQKEKGGAVGVRCCKEQKVAEKRHRKEKGGAVGVRCCKRCCKEPEMAKRYWCGEEEGGVRGENITMSVIIDIKILEYQTSH